MLKINLIAAAALLFSAGIQAAEVGGVTVGGTRLIYPGGKKETSISIKNSDSAPYLIQSWAETQKGGTDKAPFIITPPLFRLDGNQQNLLRVVFAGAPLPDDRESLYWLNIKSIPAGVPNAGSNTLQIAVKTRIKLIYRPASLKGLPDDEAEKLSWQQSGNTLTVTNPTPFYMNFHQVAVGGTPIKDITFVAPMSSAHFTVSPRAEGKITWKIINDYGGVGEQHPSKK